MHLLLQLHEGSKLIGTREFKGCLFILLRDWVADLIEIDMRHYNVILGMDWLVRHGVVIDLSKRIVDVINNDGFIHLFEGWDPTKSRSTISSWRP